MKNLNLLLTTLVISNIAIAQKLPNVQTASLRAPANIKIDGKATEWNQFQAYNKATGLFYTMCNDDENLYLAIYSKDLTTNMKMLGQGISICFNTKEKSKNNGILIKYPVGAETKKEYDDLGKLAKSIMFKGEQAKDDDVKDSLFFKLNKALIASNKYLKLFGIKELTDTLFSIYDAKGIIIGLNSQEGNLVCYELSVPLKYLKLTPASLSKLNYNIQLNEDFLSRSRPPSSEITISTGRIDDKTMMYATDFWGEYILAK
jgi:hypothetical protein